MGKSVNNPKKFIISCRVSDEEMQHLQNIADEAGTNISSLLRRSIELLQQTGQMHCANA